MLTLLTDVITKSRECERIVDKEVGAIYTVTQFMSVTDCNEIGDRAKRHIQRRKPKFSPPGSQISYSFRLFPCRLRGKFLSHV
jgi:hypothetical protein